jgi:hypothetical protein
MAKMTVARRPGAAGKMRNTEPLMISVVDHAGEVIVSGANACRWEDFLFHLGPVTPRAQLHQADRDLRATGTAALIIDDRTVDEAWIKSFLLTED